MATYSSVLETLEQTANTSTDQVKAIEATAILAGLNSYDFVVSLTVYKIFGITSKHSDVLQKVSLDVSGVTFHLQIDLF